MHATWLLAALRRRMAGRTPPAQDLPATGGRHDLHAGDARLRLNNGLDFLGADQESAKPHRVADPRLVDETDICKVGEITDPEHAVGINRPRCRRWIVKVFDEA